MARLIVGERGSASWLGPTPSVQIKFAAAKRREEHTRFSILVIAVSFYFFAEFLSGGARGCVLKGKGALPHSIAGSKQVKARWRLAAGTSARNRSEQPTA